MKSLTVYTLLILGSSHIFCGERPVEAPIQNTKTINLVGDSVEAIGSNIMVIYQDSKNVYWFGSWETGLYRYDGKTIINYQEKHGLPSNRIDEIKEDKQGNIYLNSCYPASIVTKFDGISFTTILPNRTNEWVIQKDDIWFKNSYRKQIVYRYDGVKLHELEVPNPPKYPNKFEIYSIYRDRVGNIWFGTNPLGVCRFNGSSFDWITEDDVMEFEDGGANGVRSIVEDGKGAFWFNTKYRYLVYDSVKLAVSKFYERRKSIGSLDGVVNGDLTEYLSILNDQLNNLWIATYKKGIWKYTGSELVHYPVQLNSRDITVFSIYRDNTNTLWLGTHENGALRFNGNEFEKFLLH